MGVASMNCAACRHLHAGAFSNTLMPPSSHSHPSYPAPAPPTHTHTERDTTHTPPLLCKGQQMQMTQFTSSALPRNLLHMLSPFLSLALSLHILVFKLPLRARVTLPTTPSCLVSQTGPRLINHRDLLSMVR